MKHRGLPIGSRWLRMPRLKMARARVLLGVQSMRKPRTSNGRTDLVPKALRVFAWNLGGRVTSFGKKQVALNVIERGRAWHWTKLPEGWFDLKFCLKHGQKKTRETLRELFPEKI